MNDPRPLIFLFFLLTSHFFASAQNTIDTTVFSTAQQMPEYPGGVDSLLKDISARVVYPAACAGSGIQGKVYLRFTVNEDGSTSNVQAVKSPHSLLSSAAIDALKTISKFKPGMQDGKLVKVWYSLPVNFKIKAVVSSSSLDTAYTHVDVPAEYDGGEEKLKEDLIKKMVYPTEEFQKDIQGQVILKVLINTTGGIESAIVQRGVSVGLDKEALRVVKFLSPFRPAQYQGKAVKTYRNIVVDFNLRHFEETIYIGSMNSITLSTTFANSGGLGDNRGKFLFYYFNGGYDAFSKFISKNMVYPGEALNNKTEAVLKVNCRINESLKLEPVQSLNDPQNLFTTEAFRLINLCPAFNEELRGSTFLKDTLPVNIVFVLDKRHEWGQSSQKDEEQADMLIEDGVNLYNKGKYDKALDYFTSAIRYYSLSSKAFFNRAVAELKLNDTKGACEDFRSAFLLGDLDAKTAIKQTCK